MSLESIFRLSVIVNMLDNLSGPMAGINASVDNSISKMQQMEKSFIGMTKTGTLMAGLGSQITGAVLAPVSATFDTRRALGELASVGIEDLTALETAARAFSDSWAGTSKAAFLSAAYDIKSGIASLSDVGVAEYTSLAGLTAKATKSTIGEMTSLFATGYGIYKDYYDDLSDLAFGEMFSAGIASAVKSFKTTGSGMAQSIQTLGAAATSANVPMEEQLAILGMLQATMSGSEAGTKYRALLKSAAKAGEELGLSFMDANNQLLSMPEILGQLRAKFGETIDAAEKMQLQKAFGTDEAVAVINLLYGKTGELQSNIVGLYNSMSAGTATAQRMADVINETEPERYARLRQRIQNVTETIGTGLLPTVNDLLDKGERVLSSVGNWIGRNQTLVKVLMILLLVIGGVITACGLMVAVFGGVGYVMTKTIGYGRAMYQAYRAIPSVMETLQIRALYAGDALKSFGKVITGGVSSAMETLQIRALYAGDAIKSGLGTVKSVTGSVVSGIKNVTGSMLSMAKTAAITGVKALKSMALGLYGMAKQAYTTAVSAMPGLIGSVWSFTAALLANPITWIVVGIIALIAALILLWRNWDSVTAFLTTAWTAACRGVVAAIDWIKAGINGVITWITGKIAWFGEAGRKIVTTLVGGIKSVAMAPVEAVKGVFERVRNLLPFSDAKVGPLSDLTLSGRSVLETVAVGITQAQDSPAEAVDRSFDQVRTTLREPVKKISLREVTKSEDREIETASDRANAGVIIQKLFMSVDFSKIKDIPLLIKFLKELEDFIMANSLTAVEEG